ncbi:Conserved_hypothetical protein [Hexamita inflata]|uniref:Uncharacterized protein n=1 Tax=Hexamita inflata TaxID=28002 RepID=A0AA86PYD4_9EUKA|nr:Conserved hypothetical protein [Hexamita inflata]
MFVLLYALQATPIRHGAVMRDIQIQTKQDDWMKYEIFQLDVPEATNDAQNMVGYSLVINFQASRAMGLVVCAFPTYLECTQDANALNFFNATGTVQIDGYAAKFGLTSPQIYVMFTLSGRNQVGSVTFQAQSVYILTPQSKPMKVAANQDLYLMAARCDGTSFSLLIDASATFCSNANAHVDRASCMNAQTGQTAYAFNNPDVYTFITVFATDVEQALTVEMDIRAGAFAVNETNVRKVYMNPNCYIMNSVALGKLTNYIYTQEIQNASYRSNITSRLVDVDHNQIDETSQLVRALTSTDFSVITHAKVSSPVMPWTNDEIPFLLLWFVVSKDLTELKADTVKEVASHHVLNNAVALPGMSNLQNLSYDLAFVGGEVDLSFYVTHKYGLLGDSCAVKNGRCQLLLDNNTQIKVADFILYYAVYGSFQSSVIYAPLQVMEPNTIVYDVVQKNQGSRYYRMKAKDLLEGKLYVTSNDSTAPLAVVVSSAVYLPQKTDRAVQVAEGLGAVELVLKEGSFDNGQIFVHVQNAAKKNVEVQVEFVSSNVISEILVNQEEKTIQLAKGVSVVAGVKIPAPIVTALTNGNTAAYFSQMVFQAYAALPAACDVTFDQFGSRKYFRYASLSQAQNLVSFNIKITAKALYDNEFVYVNITSECDAELSIISAAVHQMEENVDTVVPVMPNKAVFVHEVVLGIDRKISIQGQSRQSGILFICPWPMLLKQFSEESCTRSQIWFMDFNFNTEINSTQFKNAQFLYYTIQTQEMNDGKTMNVQMLELVGLNTNIEHSGFIEPNERQRFKVTSNYQEDQFYIEVKQVELGVAICVSGYYQETINARCDQTIRKPGTYLITPYIPQTSAVYLLVQSSARKTTKLVFEGYFVETLYNTTKPQILQAGKHKFFKFTRTNNDNALMLSAVLQQWEYSTDKIPEVMFEKKVAMFVNINNVARRNRYMWAETQCGAQGLVIPPSDDTDFFVTLYAKEDITVELQSIEKKHQYNLDYGKYKKISTEAAENVDFVLDSAYAPSGAIIETCTGTLKSSFSYYHVPSTGAANSQPLVTESQTNGQVKAVLNSTNDRQNFFASVETSAGAEFVLYHSYIDTRPQVSSQNIRVNMSSKDGFLTVVVDPASYVSGVRYMVYVLTEGQGNEKTACGIRRGQLISDKARLADGEAVVAINTTVALEKGAKYWLNVIAADSHDINIAVAYKPIEARLGMDLIDEQYYENEGNQDLTWIIWVVLAVIIVVVAVVALFYFMQRKKYVVLVDQDIARKDQNARRKAAQQVGGLEDSQ